MTDQLLKSFSDFAGRIASTADPKQHQEAGRRFQKDIAKIKILVVSDGNGKLVGKIEN